MGKILVVEDKYECALTAKEALSAKGEVINAYDLEDALYNIKNNTPNVVLTDMCFHGKGINSELLKKDGNLVYYSPYLEKEFQLSEEYKTALKKGIREIEEDRIFYNGISDGKKLKELESIALETELISNLMEFVWRRYSPGSEEIFKEEMSNGIKFSPPMGYYVVKEAQRRNLPTVIITSPAHAGYVLPIISKLGVEEFFRLGKEYYNLEIVRENSKRESFLKSGKVIFSTKVNREDWLLAFEQALKQTE